MQDVKAGRWQYRWALVLLVLTLAGCGFKLRGVADIPPNLGSWYVRTTVGSRIAVALSELLRVNGVALTQDIKAANIVIHILEETSTSRVITVNVQGKAISTELRYQVSFEGIRGNGQVFAERQTVSAARDYVNPDIEVLGKREEAELIRQSLEQDLANRILRQLRPHLLKLTGS